MKEVISGKLNTFSNGQVAFYCQGCKQIHAINISGDHGPKWGFNGDNEKPTFTPSVLVKYRHPKGYSNDNPAPIGYNGEYVTDVCHSFVTNGKIEYLGDSTHDLAGQTVELSPFTWGHDDD